jgi:hypothetical protein
LSLPSFLAQAQHIVTAMTGNANFPEPWPAPVPSSAQLNTDLQSFSNAYSATLTGDRSRIAVRDAARDTLTSHLQQLAYYLQMTANGDDALLASTGFDLRTPVPHTVITVPPPAPSNLRLKRGEVSGMLLVQVQKQTQATAYDVQTTSADPTVEANWGDAGIFMNCSRIEVPGLTPLKTYSVRVRAINAAGPGAWTLPVSLVVL